MAIENKKLIKLIKAKTSVVEIKEKCGFKTSTQVKNAYINALMEEGIVDKLVGGRKKKIKEIPKEVSVGGKGNISISKKIIDKLGFQVGEKFIAKKTKSGISLTKIQPSSVE